MRRSRMSKPLYVAMCIFILAAQFSFTGFSEDAITDQATALYAATVENIALNKAVTASGVEGGTNPDGTYKYPHLAPEKINDGLVNLNSRWSSNPGLPAADNIVEGKNVWIQVDLGQEYTIREIVLKWQRGNARNYDVALSTSGNSWETVFQLNDMALEAVDYNKSIVLEEPQKARYIKVTARLGNIVNGKNLQTISIYELEAYEYDSAGEMQSALETVNAASLSLSEDGSRLVLPDTQNTSFGVRVRSCSNTAVIHPDLSVTRPLSDMAVNVFLEVYEKANEQNVLYTDTPNTIQIAGIPAVDGANQKPEVYPGLREWAGAVGMFSFNGNIKIETAGLRTAAETAAMYLREMSGMAVTVSEGPPASGDIYFENAQNSFVGDEGYELFIEDVLSVRAPAEKGYVYAGASIAQILYGSVDRQTLPRGQVRDYPQYPVRSVMLDVARMYIPLDYVEEIAKYAAFYKINEIRMHINDNNGEQTAAFRVESKKYPEINRGIVTYSQQEYKEFQTALKPLGIDVVTEIDTPAHSTCMSFVRPDIMLDSSHINVSKPESLEFIKSLFDEYLDGPDPVFQSKKFHIGTDEYPKTYSEDVRKYMDELIAYVNGKGLQAAAWASLGTKGFAGTTPVRDHLAYYWSSVLASFDEMLKDGYKFVNNNASALYIVPGGVSNSFKDRYAMESMYNWEVSSTAERPYLLSGHPQMLGAEAALWNDVKVGMSEFDIFDRFRDQILLISEKTWYGPKTAGQTGTDFVRRVGNLSKIAPEANPARYVPSATELVAKYDFENASETTVPDQSQNAYNATVSGTQIVQSAESGKVLALNGNGWMSLPFESMGYPYTLRFDLTVEDSTPANAVLFSGKDGTLLYNYDQTGKFAYQRNGYTYLLDYDVVPNLRRSYTLVCTRDDLTLYVNGYRECSGAFYQEDRAKLQRSSTFVLPTEKIGSGIHGSIDNIELYNRAFSESEVTGISGSISYSNLALGKDVTVSSVEGGYKDGALVYPQFNPIHAVDGDLSTRISFGRTDGEWLIVDLGQPYLADTVNIVFNQMPLGYELYVSENNTDWSLVKTAAALEGGKAATHTIQLPAGERVRYIKYQQTKMFLDSQNRSYSGNFKELEVYGYDVTGITAVLSAAREAIQNIPQTVENKAFRDAFIKNAELLEARVNTGNFNNLAAQSTFVERQTEQLIQNNIPSSMADFTILQSLLDEDLNEAAYLPSDLWPAYRKALQYGAYISYDICAPQPEVDIAVNRIQTYKEAFILRGAVTAVAVSPTRAVAGKGGVCQFTATVTGEPDCMTDVIWSVEHGAAGTAISAGGLLTIAADETAGLLAVKAVSAQNASIYGTALVKVTGNTYQHYIGEMRVSIDGTETNQLKDGLLRASVVVHTMQNEAFCLVAAVYENGRLVEVASGNTFVNDEFVTELNITEAEKKQVKLMLIDSFETMKPYVPATIVGVVN